MKINKILADIYYTPSNPASFGSVNKLYAEAKKILPSLKLADVKSWLSGELTYTLHFPARRQFARNRIFVRYIDQQWESDLVDMKEFESENNGFKYIITIIDVFSKYAWAIPLKQKSGKSMKKAFDKIFKQRQPSFLRTDRGKEYVNKDFQDLLKEYNIHYFTSHNDTIKCAVVERFNRTLKSKMFKYFTSVGNRRYIDKLKDFITSYNNSYHRSIKMAPNEVNLSNENQVFKNLYKILPVPNKESRLKPGDKVRKKYTLGKLEKGYLPNWTDEIFTVKKTIKGDKKPYVEVKDYSGKTLNSRLYPEEVQKVTENHYRIEEILKERTRRGKKEYFVKWLHYPSKYNSWITQADLRNLN